MKFFALELLFSLLDVRGHIPRFDDFRPAPAAPGPVGIAHVLAAAIGIFVVLSLTTWATVWLAIHFL